MNFIISFAFLYLLYINLVRAECPNWCNNRGICTSPSEGNYCICDPGFTGNDCSQRVCPHSYDALIIDSMPNRRTIQIDVGSIGGDLEGSFTFSFMKASVTIPATSSSSDCSRLLSSMLSLGEVKCERIEDLYEDLDEDEEIVSFHVKIESFPLIPHFNNILFHNGNPSLNLFSCDGSSLSLMKTKTDPFCTISDVVFEDIPGFYPCGNHGACETLKGVCSCEKGFNGDSCQSNLDDQSVNYFYYDNPFFSGTLLHLDVSESKKKFDIMKVIKNKNILFNIDDEGKLKQFKSAYFYETAHFGNKFTTEEKDKRKSEGNNIIQGYSTTGENVFSVSNTGKIIGSSADLGIFKTDHESILVSRENLLLNTPLLEINSIEGQTAFSVSYNQEKVFSINEDLTTFSNMRLQSGGLQIISGGLQVESGGIHVKSGNFIIEGEVKMSVENIAFSNVEAKSISLKNDPTTSIDSPLINISYSSSEASSPIIFLENLPTNNDFILVKKENGDIIFNIKGDGSITSKGKLEMEKGNLNKLSINNLVLDPIYISPSFSTELNCYHVSIPSDSSHVIILPSPDDKSFSISFPLNPSAGYILLLTNENTFSSTSGTLIIPPFSTNLFLFNGKKWSNLSNSGFSKGISDKTDESVPVTSNSPNFQGLSLNTITELTFLNDIDVGNYTVGVGNLKVVQWPQYSIPFMDTNNELKTSVKNFFFKKNVLHVSQLKANKLAGDINGEGFKIKQVILDEVEIFNALEIEVKELKLKNSSKGFLYTDSLGLVKSLSQSNNNLESSLNYAENEKKIKIISSDIITSNLYNTQNIYLKKSNLNCKTNQEALLIVKSDGKLDCSDNFSINTIDSDEEILNVKNIAISNFHSNIDANDIIIKNLNTLEIKNLKILNDDLVNAKNSLLSIDSNGILKSVDPSDLMSFQENMKFKEVSLEKLTFLSPYIDFNGKTIKNFLLEDQKIENIEANSVKINSLTSDAVFSPVVSDNSGVLKNLDGFKFIKEKIDQYQLYSSYPISSSKILTSSIDPLPHGDNKVTINNIEVNKGNLKNIHEIEANSLSIKDNFEVLTSGFFAGSLSVQGSVVGSGPYVDSSDIKLKKQINEISSKEALNIINKINPVRYYYRTEDFPEKNLPETLQIGLIAQEVQEIIPEIVVENTDNNSSEGTLSIAYSHLTPILAGAIQEIHSELLTKSNEIKELKDSMKELQQENEKLKKLIMKMLNVNEI